jgi:hypothetical protein
MRSRSATRNQEDFSFHAGLVICSCTLGFALPPSAEHRLRNSCERPHRRNPLLTCVAEKRIGR